MTVQRARVLLGNEVEHLNDEQVAQLIATTARFCDVILEVISKKLLTKRKRRKHNEGTI